jgi:hypothetical protein
MTGHRVALVYMRRLNTARCSLADVPRTYGYADSCILVIDEDCGRPAFPSSIRSGFARVLDLLRAGRVECIFAEDITSITRNLCELHALLEAVIEQGVAVYCNGKLYNVERQTPTRPASALAVEMMAERLGSGPVSNPGAVAGPPAADVAEGERPQASHRRRADS